jgi:hypothetical protein
VSKNLREREGNIALIAGRVFRLEKRHFACQSIIDLPALSQGAYDETGKIETPQSEIGKIFRSEALPRNSG